jgi:hypothetical protein
MANFAPKNLYQLKDFFRLVYNGGFTYIDEPVGWDDVKITGSREADYWGFNYDFIDPKVNLTFVKNQGLDLLEFVYEESGSDGVVLFEYGYEQLGAKQVQYSGTVNFNTRSMTIDGVQYQIEKTFSEQLLRTRIDTKVALNATVDLDGNPVVPPTPIKIGLHSKKIVKASVGKNTVEATSPVLTTFNHSTILILPDTTNAAQAELAEMYTMPLAIGWEGGVIQNLFDLNLNQFKAAEPGYSLIEFKSKFNLVAQMNSSGGPFTNYSLYAFVYIRRAGATAYQTSQLVASGSSPDFGITIPVDFSINFPFVLQADDTIFFFFRWTSDCTRYNLVFNNYESQIKVTTQTVAAASTCYGYRLYDAINHVMQCITGKANLLSSSFFGPGGCGYKYLLTNGYQLRNFDIANKPPMASLDDLLKGIHPIWCIGLQYTINEALSQIAIIEPIRSFFGDKVVYNLRTVYDYREDHDKAITYNEVEIGYEKFPEGEINSLDEFNTFQTYLTPIKTYKAKYVQRSKFNASGYAIEAIRREQFKENPSTSISGDDDLFIISYITERVYKNMSGSFAGSVVSFSRPVGLIIGDTFTVNSGANAGTVFTVGAILSDGLTEKYAITPAPVAAAGIADLQIAISGPVAERNEAFETVSGIISPETAYNLRISPRRNLFNHARWLNGCLYKKDDAELIRNTFTKNNGDLITKLQDSDSCILTVENYTFQEKAHIAMADFNDRRRLFSSDLVSFKTRLRYDSLVRIKRSLTGQNFADTSLNYGTISFPDLNRVVWEAIVIAIEYSPVDEVATFTVRKKRKI